jgi:DNA-binding winged helix-turn-helix (wHTH) protein
LLLKLLERPGAVVAKSTLIETVWPGQAIEESNLTVQVAALRRVLSAAPGGDRWIETMPRRGYRFVGSAVTIAEGVVRRHVEVEMKSPYKKSGVAEAYYEGLRRAGLPE